MHLYPAFFSIDPQSRIASAGRGHHQTASVDRRCFADPNLAGRYFAPRRDVPKIRCSVWSVTGFESVLCGCTVAGTVFLFPKICTLFLRHGVVSLIEKWCDRQPFSDGGFRPGMSGAECVEIVTIPRLFPSSY
jgi:hypothetical protein